MWFKNYEAWEVDPQDFYKQETQDDKLRFLIRFGILAPQVFFRMGYTKKETHHSPRLLASDTTSNSC